MIDGEYVKLNTSIHTASNSSELRRDSEGNIDATIELRLPDNLWGSVNKEVEKVTMQTAKMRLSMEETPIAQIPLDLSLSSPSVKASTCKLDVYPFVLLDNDEFAPSSLEGSALPYYRSHTIQFNIIDQNSQCVGCINGAIDDPNYFGIPDSAPNAAFIKQVIDIEKFGDKLRHKMNLMISSSHEKYDTQMDQIFLKNYATLEQMFQDALENALTYGSMECVYVVTVYIIPVDSETLTPPQHTDITTDIDGVSYCYWKSEFDAISSSAVSHLAHAIKPRVRFGADTFQISYDSAAFKDIVPILWNTPYVQTYDYPEQFKLDMIQGDDWYQPPPKRVYKYGVTSTEDSYTFKLLNSFKNRVLNIVANEALYKTFSFLPWIQMPKIEQPSTSQYRLRDLEVAAIDYRRTTNYRTISSTTTISHIITLTGTAALTPVYTFTYAHAQYEEEITVDNLDTLIPPIVRRTQMCQLYANDTTLLEVTSIFPIGDNTTNLLNGTSTITSGTEVWPEPTAIPKVLRYLSDFYDSSAKPKGVMNALNSSYIMVERLDGRYESTSVSQGSQSTLNNVLPILYPKVAHPQAIDSLNVMNSSYSVGEIPLGTWSTVAPSSHQYTQFLPPYRPTSVSATWESGTYNVTVQYPAIADNRIAILASSSTGDVVSQIQFRTPTETVESGARYFTVLYETRSASLGKVPPNLPGEDTYYLLDGTTCDVSIDAAEPIREDVTSDRTYQYTKTRRTSVKYYDDTAVMLSGNPSRFTNFTYQYYGPDNLETFAPSGTRNIYGIAIEETDISGEGETPFSKVRATWTQILTRQTATSQASADIMSFSFEETYIKELSNTGELLSTTYTNTMPGAFKPDVPRYIQSSLNDTEEYTEWDVLSPGVPASMFVWFHVKVDPNNEGSPYDYVPAVPYVPTEWAEDANEYPWRPSCSPIYQEVSEGKRRLIWPIDPFLEKRYLIRYVENSNLYPTYLINVFRGRTVNDVYDVELYKTISKYPEDTAVSTSYTGNVRLTFTWNNIPTVVLSPIQSIVLVLQGMQVQAEIQPINIAQAGGSSLTSSIPVIENFYSLAATLRDLHDELVVTKDTFEDTATYALSTRAGYDRSIQISAKYIAKDGSLHQIKIPPNGVFSLQLIFKVSFYSSY